MTRTRYMSSVSKALEDNSKKGGAFGAARHFCEGAAVAFDHAG